MNKPIERTKFDDETEQHLMRYIVNRNKRTGKSWVVTRRYETTWYARAIVTNGNINVRLYYRTGRGTLVGMSYRPPCWVRA